MRLVAALGLTAAIAPVVGLVTGAHLKGTRGASVSLISPPLDVRGGTALAIVSAMALASLIGVLARRSHATNRTAWIACLGSLVALPIVTTTLPLVTSRTTRTSLFIAVAFAGWVATPPFTVMDGASGMMTAAFTTAALVGRLALTALVVRSIVTARSNALLKARGAV